MLGASSLQVYPQDGEPFHFAIPTSYIKHDTFGCWENTSAGVERTCWWKVSLSQELLHRSPEILHFYVNDLTSKLLLEVVDDRSWWRCSLLEICQKEAKQVLKESIISEALH